MFFPRHPKPLLSTKAVATQVVQQRQRTPAVDKHVLIVETAKGSTGASGASQERSVNQHVQQRLHFLVGIGQDARQRFLVADQAVDAARSAGVAHGNRSRAFIER